MPFVVIEGSGFQRRAHRKPYADQFFCPLRKRERENRNFRNAGLDILVFRASTAECVLPSVAFSNGWSCLQDLIYDP